MTERQFQARLLKALRADRRMVNAVIFKHSDMLNGGIPDVSITVDEDTQWFELKVAPNKPSKLQAHYLNKLGQGCAHVVTEKPIIQLIDIDGFSYTFEQAVNEIVRLCRP